MSAQNKNSTRRKTEATNLDPWGLSETEVPTKEHTQVNLSPIPTPTSAHLQLRFHVGPEHLEQWLSQKLLPLFGLPSLDSVREDEPNPAGT